MYTKYFSISLKREKLQPLTLALLVFCWFEKEWKEIIFPKVSIILSHLFVLKQDKGKKENLFITHTVQGLISGIHMKKKNTR